MRSSSLRVGFALLAAAAAAAGALAVRQLRQEEARLAGEALRALQERAQGVADDLQLAVEAAQDELLERLARLPAAEARAALARWPEELPLVRNAFVWDAARRRLVWPDPASPPTQETRAFLARFERLFAEQLEPLFAGPAAEAAPPPAEPARLAARASALQAARGASPPAGRRGWTPWFEGEQLSLLGWLERDGCVMGVELEMAALLSRVMLSLPREPGPSRAWALLDGAGRVVHQSGALEVRPGMKPLASAGLGSALPHGAVAVYGERATLAGRGAGARLASAVLALSLVVAILAGGGLLLWEAGRRAREARQKTSFVSNVSHELKTPLTTLRLYAELLREGRVQGEEKQRRYLDVMIGECARLGRLVNNMLDFSRLEQQRRVYAVEPLALGEWLPGLLEAQRVRLQEAGLTLEAPAALGAGLTVSTDRDALEQALLNLLDNAVKYAAAGGAVAVSAEARDGDVWLDVADRGPGVPAALRERVFEQFYRVDAALTARVPGSGLGLSIARRLMRDLGGDVRCEPREGGGARFRIVMRRA